MLFCGEPGCTKQFNKKCNMLDHLRTHSGEKPYVCDLCKKGFKQRAQLYKHQNIHGSKAIKDLKYDLEGEEDASDFTVKIFNSLFKYI